ncbi:MAG: lysophospholipid acyltransferase family protein, partial [bacterium]|nr:lysophospholipid acyltransferase family protein [bacterium]
MRERFGNSTIYKRGAARGLSRAIRQGESIAILIDQRVHPNEGIEVPFFGHSAVTTTLLARLSLRHQLPVVPMFAFPRPWGRFLVAVRPPIHPAGTGDEAVAELTARYLAAVETEIRRQPELWLWQHERWFWLNGHASWRKPGRR